MNLDSLTFTKEIFIDRKLIAGSLLALLLTSCSTLRDSLILGAGTGAVAGGVTGSQVHGDSGENAIKGAVLGAVVGGLASYIIHGSLESRDARVRREMLMNLEKFDVRGRDGVDMNGFGTSPKSSKCYSTRDVDGRLVSVPCRYVESSGDSGAVK